MKDYKDLIKQRHLERLKQGDYSNKVIYWGTYCLFVLQTPPHKPTFTEWQEYHITCVRGGIQWEPLEQAQKQWDKIQCSNSCEWWHYKDLYEL